jgi:probable F420-dependent oxidoreductase
LLVLNNDLHHPSLLARDVATLDLLSDGRVEVGIGAGHAKPEYERAGIAFDDAPTRVARLEEAVVALRSLLDGDTVDLDGEHFTLRGARCEPRPVQGHVPVLVGGAGRRVHRIAARHADAVGFTGLGRALDDGQKADPTRFSARCVHEDVEAVGAAAGDRLTGLELQVLVQAVVVTGDAARASDEIARAHLPSLQPAEIIESPYMMVGTTAAIVEKLLEHRERWGFSHYTVRREALGHLGPVIAELAGR